ncbi:hypothetical protein T01_10454, partial [Trichinella spiralis]
MALGGIFNASDGAHYVADYVLELAILVLRHVMENL